MIWKPVLIIDELSGVTFDYNILKHCFEDKMPMRLTRGKTAPEVA